MRNERVECTIQPPVVTVHVCPHRTSTSWFTPALVRGRWRQNSLEETLMLPESSPSLLVALQMTVRLALGTMLMLWVALPLA